MRAFVCRVDLVKRLLACYFCTGFWSSLAVLVITGRFNEDPTYLSVFVESLGMAAFVYAVDIVLMRLEVNE